MAGFPLMAEDAEVINSQWAQNQLVKANIDLSIKEDDDEENDDDDDDDEVLKVDDKMCVPDYQVYSILDRAISREEGNTSSLGANAGAAVDETSAPKEVTRKPSVPSVPRTTLDKRAGKAAQRSSRKAVTKGEKAAASATTKRGRKTTTCDISTSGMMCACGVRKVAAWHGHGKDNVPGPCDNGCRGQTNVSHWCQCCSVPVCVDYCGVDQDYEDSGSTPLLCSQCLCVIGQQKEVKKGRK